MSNTEYHREWRAKNRQKVNDSNRRYRQTPAGKAMTVKSRRRAILKRRYGMTPEEYDALLERQERCCASCGDALGDQSHEVHVDHCHVSLKVRGILCRNCNLAAGNAKDDPERLRALADYLERHSGPHT